MLGVEDVGGDGVLEVHVERVARGHQVPVVDELDEGLHARLLAESFFMTMPGYFFIPATKQ